MNEGEVGRVAMMGNNKKENEDKEEGERMMGRKRVKMSKRERDLREGLKRKIS